ncbi:hypothetical protein KL936_003838 [Ogataea polymorpha]|nr:hypothetical protein KL936_003838 [Ogataea polymorpha]
MIWHWNWETVWWSFHILALFLRLECVSWLSYIHPDEFFQTFQPLFNDNVPWEFQHACRSIVPIKWIQIVVQSLGESPIGSYKLVKLIYSLMTLIAIQVTLRKLHLRRRDFSTALLLADTSYVTLVYQSHTFSNSIETCVLLYTVWIINDMRKALETKEKNLQSGTTRVASILPARTRELSNHVWPADIPSVSIHDKKHQVYVVLDSGIGNDSIEPCSTPRASFPHSYGAIMGQLRRYIKVHNQESAVDALDSIQPRNAGFHGKIASGRRYSSYARAAASLRKLCVLENIQAPNMVPTKWFIIIYQQR